jgi:hypothetical protein
VVRIFRETNAIEGELGEGTGGVTEAAKRRIVLPFAGPIESTDHVLGHELVHAFQYDITNTNASTTSFQLPATSYQLPATSFRLPTRRAALSWNASAFLKTEAGPTGAGRWKLEAGSFFHFPRLYRLFNHRVTSASMSLTFDAVSDAILFRESTGVDQPARWLRFAERESEIDSCVGRRPDLREDVLAIERDNGLGWAGLDVLAERQPESKEAIVDRPQCCALARVHRLHVTLGCLEVYGRIQVGESLAGQEVGDPLGVARRESMCGFEPFAARRCTCGAVRPRQRRPLVGAASGALFNARGSVGLLSG